MRAWRERVLPDRCPRDPICCTYNDWMWHWLASISAVYQLASCQGTDAVSVEAIQCSHCSKSNPLDRLWCSACGAPLGAGLERPAIGPIGERQTFAQVVPASDHRATGNLSTRAELYQRVLDDLKNLSLQREVDTDTYRAIRTFYDAQLNSIRQHIAEQDFVAARQRFFHALKNCAHAGRLEEALGLIDHEIRRYPDDSQLARLHQEVTEQVDQRLLAVKKSQEVQVLLQESDKCLATLQYAEAIAKLSRAHQLEPENRRVTMTLHRAERLRDEQQAAPIIDAALVDEAVPEPELGVSQPGLRQVQPPRASVASPAPSFAEEELSSPVHRFVEAASKWSSFVKPFLLDNVGWFVGAFLVIAGFVVLIVTFWNTIEQNQILMQSLVFAALLVATSMFFAAAYYMRLKYPRLESSSDVLLVIVALLIPLVFAAAVLTALVPADVTSDGLALLQQMG